MDLFMIRHAQSTNNALTSQMDRGSDPPLTPMGLRQAQLLGQHLVNEFEMMGHNQPTRLFCSPMWRSLHTAQFVGQALDLTPEVWTDIHECGGIYLDHGAELGRIGYPGRTRQEMLDHFTHYKLPPDITDEGWWKGGHEEWPACCGRAVRVVQQLRSLAGNDERLILITHGGFMDLLMKTLLNNLPGDNVFYWNRNTGVSHVALNDGQRMDVFYMDRVDHLPPNLVS